LGYRCTGPCAAGVGPGGWRARSDRERRGARCRNARASRGPASRSLRLPVSDRAAQSRGRRACPSATAPPSLAVAALARQRPRRPVSRLPRLSVSDRAAQSRGRRACPSATAPPSLAVAALARQRPRRPVSRSPRLPVSDRAAMIAPPVAGRGGAMPSPAGSMTEGRGVPGTSALPRRSTAGHGCGSGGLRDYRGRVRRGRGRGRARSAEVGGRCGRHRSRRCLCGSCADAHRPAWVYAPLPAALSASAPNPHLRDERRQRRGARAPLENDHSRQFRWRDGRSMWRPPR
jgi:hypothetical protein